ncbi:hypothetical protein K458DRAFT_63961 [Lentithecium fluviatile CBS 122367]|uniref:C2H2-type domain-containing protein n=1 Tax=Lentithecium fluviatile CBS 122367 TaxID=1168545 RepID=A0A6G1JJX9_9PLEO|nr:hypothetical protein K458DRAFT_63961 [Lentithecium fluviatile CBS 122367]
METQSQNVGGRNLALPSPTGKRNHDVLVTGSVDSNDQSPRSPKSARLGIIHGTDNKPINMDDTADHSSTVGNLTAQMSCPLPYRKFNTGTLTDRQKVFIQQWHQNFAASFVDPSPASESINALATLVQSPPQPIRDYLDTEYGPLQRASTTTQSPPLSQPSGYDERAHSRASYTLREANHHLPPDTLALVEKYVSSCRRRRAQKDGRRSVNEGPLECTYGCGYRTKRAFDWRRHEETHEPQELWLCHLCRQNGEHNPFLVNRKDKFLRHVKDAHKKWEPETVLDMSRVDFQADFDPRCRKCPEVSRTWDDRCRHVLSHYEDGLLSGGRQGRGGERDGKGKEGMVEQECGDLRVRTPSREHGDEQSNTAEDKGG